ncbi:uncharacterized protein EKO05_0005338 [Ascochyta rabiei]|uniref:Uncharacterized protein n=1 Tax=Didymella rabiei TaxID=5454 RepID=A0A163JN22_DIDRA|nr:uncharacterized protein EKO05_0005338 [Ascochyta rabiei]KZM26463.1 hypothetical protein ST47_g2202 [Ascochyta rabiei]UPX14867.1 hypothetical protein EKO05_0005338 [Ascochyta rabiei]
MLPSSFGTLSTREQSRYLRSIPEQQRRILRDHEDQCQAAFQRLLDTALEEVDFCRDHGLLQPGVYRNECGYELHVWPNGQRSEVSICRSPGPNIVWAGEPRRLAWPVPPQCQYKRGTWQLALPAAPVSLPADQQQSRRQTATGFERWRIDRVNEQTSVSPQVLSSELQQWQLQQSPIATPIAYGSEQVSVAALPGHEFPPQLYTPVAAGPQQPPPSPVAAQQQSPDFSAAVPEQIPSSCLAIELESENDPEFSEFLMEMDAEIANESSRRAAAQQPLGNAAYPPGYEPATSI